jgi:hypothetical protein
MTIRQGYLIIRLMAALGAKFFGLPKCNLKPLQELRWLGFLLNTLDETFKVAPSKLAKIKQVLQEAIANPSTSNQELASLAGKLVALSPAVLPALLFLRSIFQAMEGHESWDTWFPSPSAVKQEAQMWLDNVDSWNGRPWLPRQVQFTLQIDASALGYGGYLQEPNGTRHPIAGTFSREEGESFSAARETIGYVRSICIASQRFASKISDSAILLHGDCQAALGAIKKLASPVPIIHQELKRLFKACAAGKFDIIPRWVPRQHLQEAYELSRRPDASDWGCTTDLVELVLCHFHTTIELDVFASHIHHATDRFISAFYVPSCIALQAFASRLEGASSSFISHSLGLSAIQSSIRNAIDHQEAAYQRHYHHGHKDVIQRVDSSSQSAGKGVRSFPHSKTSGTLPPQPPCSYCGH